MKYIIASFLVLLMISGCSRRPQAQTYHTPQKYSKTSSAAGYPKTYHTPTKYDKSTSKTRYPEPSSTATAEKTSSRIQRLYKQYNAWKGTPYEYGGLSQDGIDCSGFVHQTYKDLFNITLARSTKDQVRQGKRVYINELSAGDLVFFKIGLNVRHVGIYLEKGKFAHASSSNGVMISSMHTGYWKENYWQARRLL